MLTVTPNASPDLLHIVVQGEISSATAPQFDQALAGCLAGGTPPRWVLDLGGLTFTSSAGLRVFLAYAKKKIKNAGGRLVLCRVQPAVLEVLEVSGFTQILMIAPDLAAARPLLGAG